MSFHRRKKKDIVTIDANSQKINKNEQQKENEISNVETKKILSRESQEAEIVKELNGAFSKFKCDNNNRNSALSPQNNLHTSDNNSLSNTLINDVNSSANNSIFDKDQHSHTSQLDHHTGNGQVSIPDSSRAKRKFVILAKILRPWKWKRKKQKEFKRNGEFLYFSTNFFSFLFKFVMLFLLDSKNEANIVNGQDGNEVTPDDEEPKTESCENAQTQPAYMKGAIATPLIMALSKNPEHTQQLKTLLNKRQSSLESSDSGSNAPLTNSQNDDANEQGSFRTKKGLPLPPPPPISFSLTLFFHSDCDNQKGREWIHNL